MLQCVCPMSDGQDVLPLLLHAQDHLDHQTTNPVNMYGQRASADTNRVL